MRIHILQHESFESPGIIEDWIRKKNHKISFTRFYEKDNLPDLDELDWLIIMGGPMGVYDEEKFPWLKDEKIFIKHAINEGKIVLGICLGSQLIAASLGAKVYPNKFKEIGWMDVSLTENSKINFLFSSLPKKMKVFQWHGDTFDLPLGTVHLARSEACKNQAFIFKEGVLALQFHCEVTESTLHEMLEASRNELEKGKYIQTAEEILSHKNLISSNNKIMLMLLDKLEKLNHFK